MSSTLASTATTMLAVVKSSQGVEGVVVQRVEVPNVPPGYARVRVAATGICGTDVHIAHDEYAHEAPVVMGHEISGTVDQVGDGADSSWIGKRVACETYFSTCQRCQWCRAGRPNLCGNRRSLGSFEHGGFAEFVVLPVVNLHQLPPHVDVVSGALAEPLACVTQCLMNPAVVQAGDRVLVTGPGAMGQLAAQVARAHGAQVTIAGLPRDAERLDVARSFGVGVTTEAVEPDLYDVSIECSGSAPGIAAALTGVRRGGRYVQVGIAGREVQIPFDNVLYKELVVSSGFASTPESWRSAMSLLEAGLVSLGPLVTQRVGISDFSAALAAAERGAGLKTVVSAEFENLT